jgi:hypothetical protein
MRSSVKSVEARPRSGVSGGEELRGSHRIDRRARTRADLAGFRGVKSDPMEPLEGEPQAEERLPDDLRDGRDALPRGLLWDQAKQHGDP